jgi:hypothetical protein
MKQSISEYKLCSIKAEKFEKNLKRLMKRLLNGEEVSIGAFDNPEIEKCLIQNNILGIVKGNYVWNRPIVKKAMEKFPDDQKQD